MSNKVKWAFLCSSWGRNAKDVIDWHVKNNQIDKIGLVIYESIPCGAANSAKKNNIKQKLIDPRFFKNRDQYQQAVLSLLIDENITHLFLLGYKWLIKPPILNAFPDRIINIHPSLFPSFLGTKTAIQDALEYGVKISGITTHIIDNRFDRGTIICQEPIRIDEEDTFETLYDKFSKKGLPIILETMKMVENSN